MTQKEFASWMKYHCAAFPGIVSWLARFDESPDEYAPSRKDVIATWLKALGFVTLADARSATDDMHSGREEAPQYFDRHPTCVAAIAAKRRRTRSTGTKRFVEGEYTYRCLTCRDSGFVTCWHPKTLVALARGENVPNTTCAVRCTCDMGMDRKAVSDSCYSPAKWLRIDWLQVTSGDREDSIPPWPSEPEQTALAQAWRKDRAKHLPNYERDFD